jgi:uncharacterized MAPEG superfamily protein
MRAQRAHQQNVEIMCVFLPVLLLAGLPPSNTLNIFYAGVAALVFRSLGQVAYVWNIPFLRSLGGLWHVSELYIVYSTVRFGLQVLWHK